MKLALLSMFLALPLSAQTRTDTLDAHHGDTLRIVVPAGCPARCWLDIKIGATSYLRHTLLRLTPPPLPAPPPPAPAPAPPPAPVPPPAPSGTVLFASDFGSGTVQDGGRWPIFGGAGLSVIRGDSLGFPMTNVLRVDAVPARGGFGTIRTTGLPVPGVGESRYYRVYFRAAWPDNIPDNGSHPIQDGQAGSQINWELQLHHNQGGAGAWVLAFQLDPGNGFADYVWNGPVLRKQVTYRFEWQVERLSATTFALHVRIYDSSGALLYDDDDFVNQGTGAARRTLAQQPAFLFNNVANLDGLNAGLNGIAGTYSQFTHSYQGGFAVCTSWCGSWR